MNNVYFCPKCHKRVVPPNWLNNANLQAENGVTIKCGDVKCNGKVKIKLKTNIVS